VREARALARADPQLSAEVEAQDSGAARSDFVPRRPARQAFDALADPGRPDSLTSGICAHRPIAPSSAR
jgi:hypothetical protein